MAYNLSTTGTPTYGTGKSGQCLLTGVGTSTVMTAALSGGVTVEVWVKSTAISVRAAIQLMQAWIGQNASGYATFGTITNGTLTASTTPINDGAWHHLALTNDGTTSRLWVDGTQAVSAADAGYGSSFTATSSYPFAVGGLRPSTSFDWTGSTDLARVSNYVRYTGVFTPAAPYTDDAATVALYNLDGDLTDAHSFGAAATAPGAPTALTATLGAGQVALSWTAPSSNGGAALSDYTVQYSADGGSTWTAFSHAASTSTTSTVTSLANGTAYTFRVAAVNSAGTSAYSPTAAATPSANSSSPTIAATDANVVYSPGNWGTSGGNMKTINAGASFRTRITAAGVTAFALNFSIGNDLTPLPQIEYRIDGGPWNSQEITASISIAIPSTNVWASHLLEFRVKSTTETQPRWSTTSTEVVFTGISAAGASSVTTTAIKTKPLRALYFGDSITEGVRTLGGTTITKDTDRNSAAAGWAFLSAEMLGAEAGIIGFGATGLTVAGSGAVPAVNSTYNLLWGSGPARDFSTLDFVVLNEGTNDSAASSATFTAAYTLLLNNLLSATSSTCTIIAMRPFNGTHDADIQTATVACSNPLRVAYLDTTGMFNTSDAFDGLHPYGFANSTVIAPQVAAAIRAILKVQTTMLLNLGGAAVPAVAFTQ